MIPTSVLAGRGAVSRGGRRLSLLTTGTPRPLSPVTPLAPPVTPVSPLAPPRTTRRLSLSPLAPSLLSPCLPGGSAPRRLSTPGDLLLGSHLRLEVCSPQPAGGELFTEIRVPTVLTLHEECRRRLSFGSSPESECPEEGPGAAADCTECTGDGTRGTTALVSPTAVAAIRGLLRRYASRSSSGDCSGDSPRGDDIRQIGQGGFGHVYVVTSSRRHHSAHTPPTPADSGKLVFKRLYRKCSRAVAGHVARSERNALRLSPHPNIVRVLDVVSVERSTDNWVVMTYGGPHDLLHLIDHHKYELHYGRILRIGAELARALSYCHSKGLLHLDVKPSNILISADYGTCKLCDFGCSSMVSSDSPDCGEESVCLQGTYAYRSPELLRGQPATCKCDVYSYGVTLWHLLHKVQPYDGMNPQIIAYRVVAQGLRPDTCGDLTDQQYEHIRWLHLQGSTGVNRLLDLCRSCWQADPQSRPAFTEIISNVATL